MKQASEETMLANFLKDHYTVQSLHPPLKDLPSCDLLIIDGYYHSRYKEQIAQNKENQAPIFFPILALIKQKDTQHWSSSLWTSVDDFIITPVSKQELLSRVAILMRARQQSIDLNQTKEELIAQSKEQLNLAIKATKVAFWSWDIQEKKVYYSPEWKSLLGYSNNELQNNLKTFLSRIHPEDKPEVIARLKEYLHCEQKNSQCEFRLRHRNGNYIRIFSTAAIALDSSKGVKKLLGAHVDITDIRKNKEDMELFNRALEQSPASVIITNKEGNIIYVNSEFEKLSGYQRDEILNRNPRFLKSGITAPTTHQQLWEKLNRGENWEGEFCNQSKDGKLFWVESNISPVTNSKGNITHYIAVQKDITEKRRMMEELIQAKEKAEESDRLKSAFLANVSHEIRTPMNGILGFTELLKNQDINQEQKNNFLNIITTCGKRMLSMINDLIDISKIEAGLMDVQLAPCNFNELIDQVCKLLLPEAMNKAIRLTQNCPLPNEQANIICDAEKLYAILLNLAKNAVKYTDEGIIEVGYHLENSQPQRIKFYVSDTGIGINKNNQEAIFMRFIQENTEKKKARQGTGLGLSIAKAYVELLGGTIGVESEPDKGSVFHFTLPFTSVNNTDNNITEEPCLMDPAPNSKLTILIAEDDSTSAQYLSILLSSCCRQIYHANNGKMAVELSREHPEIDLILMDIQMPGMNGYEATSMIRQFNQDVIIIAQTAYAMLNDEAKALQAGCNAHLRKPIQKNKLMASIRKFTQARMET